MGEEYSDPQEQQYEFLDDFGDLCETYGHTADEPEHFGEGVRCEIGTMSEDRGAVEVGIDDGEVRYVMERTNGDNVARSEHTVDHYRRYDSPNALVLIGKNGTTSLLKGSRAKWSSFRSPGGLHSETWEIEE